MEDSVDGSRVERLFIEGSYRSIEPKRLENLSSYVIRLGAVMISSCFSTGLPFPFVRGELSKSVKDIPTIFLDAVCNVVPHSQGYSQIRHLAGVFRVCIIHGSSTGSA